VIQVVRGLVLGALVGALLGAVSRALMHLVDIGMGFDPDFHVDVSVGIAILFVLSGAGAGVARSLGLRGWQSGFVILMSSVGLLVAAGTYADDKVQQILDRDLTPPWTIELVAMVAVIVGLALVTPYAGWRVGRSSRPVAALREPAGARR
jgi:hypothetical protein